MNFCEPVYEQCVLTNWNNKISDPSIDFCKYFNVTST